MSMIAITSDVNGYGRTSSSAKCIPHLSRALLQIVVLTAMVASLPLAVAVNMGVEVGGPGEASLAPQMPPHSSTVQLVVDSDGHTGELALEPQMPSQSSTVQLVVDSDSRTQSWVRAAHPIAIPASVYDSNDGTAQVESSREAVATEDTDSFQEADGLIASVSSSISSASMSAENAVRAAANDLWVGGVWDYAFKTEVGICIIFLGLFVLWAAFKAVAEEWAAFAVTREGDVHPTTSLKWRWRLAVSCFSFIAFWYLAFVACVLCYFYVNGGNGAGGLTSDCSLASLASLTSGSSQVGGLPWDKTPHEPQGWTAKSHAQTTRPLVKSQPREPSPAPAEENAKSSPTPAKENAKPSPAPAKEKPIEKSEPRESSPAPAGEKPLGAINSVKGKECTVVPAPDLLLEPKKECSIEVGFNVTACGGTTCRAPAPLGRASLVAVMRVLEDQVMHATTTVINGLKLPLPQSDAYITETGQNDEKLSSFFTLKGGGVTQAWLPLGFPDLVSRLQAIPLKMRVGDDFGHLSFATEGKHGLTVDLEARYEGVVAVKFPGVSSIDVPFAAAVGVSGHIQSGIKVGNFAIENPSSRLPSQMAMKPKNIVPDLRIVIPEGGVKIRAFNSSRCSFVGRDICDPLITLLKPMLHRGVEKLANVGAAKGIESLKPKLHNALESCTYFAFDFWGARALFFLVGEESDFSSVVRRTKAHIVAVLVSLLLFALLFVIGFVLLMAMYCCGRAKPSGGGHQRFENHAGGAFQERH